MPKLTVYTRCFKHLTSRITRVQTINVMTSSTKDSTSIHLFQMATQIVYGRIDDTLLSSEESAEKWTPPDTPGAGGHGGRYLWTDAFGVVNFITLAKETSSPVYLTLAKRLVSTVHSILGRTRDGSSHLPLATDDEPLKGGLRIGKVDAGGSDGDGQYHHYLTLWMFALNRLAVATGVLAYNRLAVQLARAIHPYFVFRKGGDSRTAKMVWKVSTDLRSVLVPSEGHLDAATGFVVYRLLERTAEEFGDGGGVLDQEIADYREIMGRPGKLRVSGDPLDLGMGLWMCHFCRDQEWARKFGQDSLDVAREVLDEKMGLMMRSAAHRLAFREFGTCMGLKCYGMDGELETGVEAVLRFWEKYLDDSTDEDLRPISLVMFAAALITGAFRDGYLTHK